MESPLGWILDVTFPVSVAFMTIPGAFGGAIILLPKYDITLYVSFIGFTLNSIFSPVKNRLPKVAFETLLLVVLVVLLTASCSTILRALPPVSNGSVPPFHSHSLMVSTPGYISCWYIANMLSRNASFPVEFVL